MGFRLIKLLGHALVTMIFCSSSYSILDGNDTNKEFVVVDFIEPHFGTNIKFGKKCDCILKSIPWWFLKCLLTIIKCFDHQALFFEPCLRHRSLSKGQLSHQRVWNHDRFGDQSWFNMQVVRPFRVRLRVWWVSEKEIVLKLKVMEFFMKKNAP